jgi:ubiquinone/menaquinone biosynthesis C-methylase UbiE
MDEVQYYKTIYNKFWEIQTKKYGFAVYEQNLVNLILKSKPKKVFEVGIGTGWPIGAALKEKGIEIDGCDIAESAVALAQKELCNKKGIWVGDVMEYAGEDEIYDVTYCVRASWYIPNFHEKLLKMISMTKQGGYIIFDVMDKNSLYYLKCKYLDIKEKYLRFLGVNVDVRFGMRFVSISKMRKFIKENKLTCQFWYEKDITHSQDNINTPKVVFLCRKGK